MNRISIATIALAVAACSKSADPAPPAPTSSAALPPAASASPLPAASAPTTSAAPGGGSWSGHYTASPGPFYMPDGGEWAIVRFRGEDASVGLGEGTLTVTVGATGQVQGSVDGPLGPLRVSGQVTGGLLTAALLPGDPALGFSGTAAGKQEGASLTGTMHLSLPTGNVLREASFSLQKKP